MQFKPSIADVENRIALADSLEEIGEGGFKVVYRGLVGGELEAIKLVHIPVDPNDPTVEESNRRRLLREVDLISRCTSPSLAKVGQIPPTCCTLDSHKYVFYSEELINGTDLREAINLQRVFSQSELSILGCVLLDAVASLVALDAIHRDIKPANIIMTDDVTRPYVLFDLGLAFIVGGTCLTANTQALPGTRYYLAPEMLDSGFRNTLDYRADLYAIGLALYECASGVNPFAHRADMPHATLYRIKNENPKPLELARPDLNADFCRLIDQWMKKIPALRPANIPLLLRRMEAWR